MSHGHHHHHRVHSSIKDDYKPLLDYYRKRDAQLNPHLHQQHEHEDDEHVYQPYRPSANLSRSASHDELPTLSSAADVVRAEHNIINRRVQNRLQNSVLKPEDAVRMSKHFQNYQDDNEDDSTDEDQDEYLRKMERERLLRIKRRMDTNREVEFSADFKRAIRGQSPNTIAEALLAESDKNIKAGKKEEREFVTHAMGMNQRARPEHHHSHHRQLHTAAEYHHHRPLSLTEHHYRPTSTFSNDRLIDDFDYKVSSELRNVRRDLSKLSTRTSEFYADSKCVPRIASYQSKNLPRRYEYEAVYTPSIRTATSPRPWLSPPHTNYHHYNNDHIAISSMARSTCPGTSTYSYRHIH